MSVSYTPMMDQYRNIKQQHPNEILFFRLGDFYEMFFDDAELAAKELEITLTSREGGQNIRVPMCGIPYHAAENYLARLIAKGYKVAICEQVEDPKQAKGIVRREVTKIITPGTVISELLLPSSGNNYLALLLEEENTLYLVAADISTGECMWASFAGSARLGTLCDHLYRLMPSELIVTGKIDQLPVLHSFLANRIPQCTQTTLMIDDFIAIRSLPAQHFSAEDLPADTGPLTAISCLLHYLHQTMKCDLSHINRLTQYNDTEHLIIDTATLRNLEITHNVRDGGKKGTLLSVLDFTKTAMGGRLLKNWLEYPLLKISTIINRQDAVAELVEKPSMRQSLQEKLAVIYDFERIMTRIEVGTSNARDLISLQTSLAALPAIKQILQTADSVLLSSNGLTLHTHNDTVNLIEAAIAENPPLSIRDGGMIKAGYDLELDELRNIARDSKQWVQDMETREREATGIKSLKIGYNKVFGYYIEITNSNIASAPMNYVRKQTLANAERFITPELKEFETKILGAQEKIVNIEYYLFTTIRDYIKKNISEIQHTARQIAQIDCLVSFAETAVRYNYNRPTIHSNNGDLLIRDGRHPVVERLLVREMFVPNDTLLDHRENEIMVITGPNMAGKSTYMRQVALLTLLAQTGSFIPAREAKICPVDRIFTRVGASDDLATGQSTFMVEMTEVAHILKHATANSLVILDEIGRGTSTFDGMSIARSVIEYIKEKIKAKTLFATHYHELTELADREKGIVNYSVAVKERGNEIIFLRRIVPGGADKSYGIHVAQLAGLPKKIIERSQDFLNKLENGSTTPKVTSVNNANPKHAVDPLSLFSNSLADELSKLDVMTITPLEAINLLFKLHNQAKQEMGQL